MRHIATQAGIEVRLVRADHVTPALDGADVGTTFAPTGPRRPTRLLWLAHATSGVGALHLDAGAVRAVVERRASLLAAGVTSVQGGFSAGDPVDLLDPDGRAVARGLVNYDAGELPALLGRSTGDLARDLGPVAGVAQRVQEGVLLGESHQRAPDRLQVQDLSGHRHVDVPEAKLGHLVPP